MIPRRIPSLGPRHSGGPEQGDARDACFVTGARARSFSALTAPGAALDAKGGDRAIADGSLSSGLAGASAVHIGGVGGRTSGPLGCASVAARRGGGARRGCRSAAGSRTDGCIAGARPAAGRAGGVGRGCGAHTAVVALLRRSPAVVRAWHGGRRGGRADRRGVGERRPVADAQRRAGAVLTRGGERRVAGGVVGGGSGLPAGERGVGGRRAGAGAGAAARDLPAV